MANPYSTVKIFHHAGALDAIRKGERIAPFYIRIKPTNYCNHHCAYCCYGSGDTKQQSNVRDAIRHRDMLPWDKFREIIADMGDMGVKAMTFSGGGEPLTYPHILGAVSMLRSRGIDVSLISNGQLLKGKIAEGFYGSKWVRVSFDSPVEGEYMKQRGLHGGAFQEVVANIRDFAKNKSQTCTLGINFVVTRSNYRHLYEAARLIKSLGCDNIKFAALVDNERDYHADIKDEAIRQIHQAKTDFEDESFRIFNNYENEWMDKNFTRQSLQKCYTCRLVTVIAADSRMYLCHNRAYNANAVLGDLSDKSLKELWFSDEVSHRLDSLFPPDDCKNICAYEERNKMIQAYYDSDGEHVNFI